METHGRLSPTTETAVRDAYEELGPAARTVVREVARAMEFDREEYRERITGDVVATARDALFASLLRVHVGDRETFEDALDDRPDFAVVAQGSEHVDGVAWHVAPFAETVLAATFQDEPDAAVAALRRQAFGRLYRDAL